MLGLRNLLGKDPKKSSVISTLSQEYWNLKENKSTIVNDKRKMYDLIMFEKKLVRF
jgi:hypothetical protein